MSREEAQKLGIAAESLEHVPGRLLRQCGVEASRVHADLDRGRPLRARYGFHCGKPNRTTITNLGADNFLRRDGRPAVAYAFLVGEAALPTDQPVDPPEVQQVSIPFSSGRQRCPFLSQGLAGEALRV